MTDQPQPLLRKIIHIDMDAFYASVEQRDFPEYRGKPLVVGGKPDSRGVVATASYEARQFGIRSAMSCNKAYQLCPTAIFVYPRFDAYSAVSKSIREIFSRYTDLIEPLSLDEAYLDVTEDKLGIGSAMDIAKSIKDAIKNELNLTASAGVSINKFVAKVASDMNKPDGLTFIGPSKIEAFMEKLPVEKFFGVGKVTAAKMKAMQITTGADLKKLTEVQLLAQFGKSGKFYYQIVRGVDNRPVQPHRETKSVGAEDTLAEDTNDDAVMHDLLKQISETVAKRLEKYGLKGKTVTLKIKFSDFKLITRSRSFSNAIDAAEVMYAEAIKLLNEAEIGNAKVRLLGITLSRFYDDVLPEKIQDNQLEFDF
ncbi:DNA polymerase IV [Pedobacter rhizosphaerae]|uniref:DNA polymerase IV n=1 Tax=Pedobacter rhizosphaerae TaxID=390241 RepID=A0A1H9UF55_9SPHI|nr:DNA polymerase IV [Pedobacter rhizosphaerae]SES07992.1 DNA polymerase-4 [Pedobacter rhizosphaerae]